ncbi:MAG TPA: hypothetical protein VMT62_02970 [Syntrophorhabdaceae bacterium]|nr:hypothetical protein [Syntrophorhabdaceae bacterium]
MGNSSQEIISKFTSYADRQGSGYANWYVGVTVDWRRRLFVEHHVFEKDEWWISREAISNKSARQVRDALHAIGFTSEPGGEQGSSRFVYAYLKLSGVTHP